MTSIVDFISNRSSVPPPGVAGAQAIEDFRGVLDENAGSFAHRLRIAKSTLTATGSLANFSRFKGDTEGLKASCAGLARIASVLSCDDVCTGFRASAAASAAGGGAGNGSADRVASDTFMLLLGHDSRLPHRGDIAVTPELLKSFEAIEVVLVAIDKEYLVFSSVALINGAVSILPPGASLRVPVDKLDAASFLILGGTDAAPLVAGFADIVKEKRGATPTAAPSATSAQAPQAGPIAMDVATIAASIGAAIGPVVREVMAASRVQVPTPSGDHPAAVSSERLKGKDTLIRFSRFVPPLGAALRNDPHTDVKSWGAQVKILLQGVGIYTTLPVAESLGRLKFSTRPLDPESLSALYNARFGQPASAVVNLENQLSTLTFIIAAMCGGDANFPFVEHMRLSVANLIQRIRRAQSDYERSVYATRILPRLFDEIEACVANTATSAAQLHADYPDGWFAKNSTLADWLDAEVASAQAHQIAALEKQLAAKQDGDSRKRRERERGDGQQPRPLADVCATVILSGKEARCTKVDCKLQHAFPPGATEQDKAAAKSRISQLRSAREAGRSGDKRQKR